MNFKKTAKQLEQFLEEELTHKPPIILMPDGSLAYNNFVIKKNQHHQWDLKRSGGYIIDSFNLKSTAVAAAKLYSSSNFRYYDEIKILDSIYAKNVDEAEIFKIKYQTTKSIELRDLYIARYVEAKSQADFAKKQIVKQFKTMF